MSSALMVNVTKPRQEEQHDFGQAVSELAAHWLPREGRRGTEQGGCPGIPPEKQKFCKKFAASFNNCCKDSGWGQDVGLARCSSEERRWPKRKSKLTVSIGNSALKKVLKLLEKKGAIASSAQNWRRSFSAAGKKRSAAYPVLAATILTVGHYRAELRGLILIPSWISPTLWTT